MSVNLHISAEELRRRFDQHVADNLAKDRELYVRQMIRCGVWIEPRDTHDEWKELNDAP